jgi:hypothetical protein
MANKPLILTPGGVTESASPQLSSVNDTNAATLLTFTQRGVGAAVNNLQVSNSAAGNACGVALVGFRLRPAIPGDPQGGWRRSAHLRSD